MRQATRCTAAVPRAVVELWRPALGALAEGLRTLRAFAEKNAALSESQERERDEAPFRESELAAPGDHDLVGTCLIRPSPGIAGAAGLTSRPPAGR